MLSFKLAMVAALSTVAFARGLGMGKGDDSSSPGGKGKGKSSAQQSQARLESTCGCGTEFVPVCCRSASSPGGLTFASVCDAECDVSCNSTDDTTTIDAGPCADSDGDQGRVGGSDDPYADVPDEQVEFRLIPGYSFHMRNSACNGGASYFGPPGSGVSLGLCLLGCNSAEDCLFVTYTRSGYCRYW